MHAPLFDLELLLVSAGIDFAAQAQSDGWITSTNVWLDRFFRMGRKHKSAALPRGRTMGRFPAAAEFFMEAGSRTG